MCLKRMKPIVYAALLASVCMPITENLSYAETASCAVFEESEIKQYALENWDEDGDGCINAQEADNVRDIPIMAFYKKNLKTLNDLKQFNNLDTIGESAFRACKALTVIDLPQIKYIADNAFTDTAAYEINLPNVVEIGEEAFLNARPNVTKPKVTYRFPKLRKLGPSAFANITPQAPAEASYFLGTNIPKNAFKNNRLISKFSLTSQSDKFALTAQSNEIEIGISAFESSSIQSFSVSGGHVGIARDAFANSSLTTFTGPRAPGLYENPSSPGIRLSEASIHLIGDGAFKNTKLTKLNIFIDMYAFRSNYCKSKDTQYCPGANIFEGTNLKVLYMEAPMARCALLESNFQTEVFDSIDTEEIILKVPIDLKKLSDTEWSGGFFWKEWKSIQFIR